MTSTSKQREIEVLVNQQLDEANARLSDSVRADISQARLAALKEARAQKQKPSHFLNVENLFTGLSLPRWQYSTPLAVALGVVILVSYTSRETLPPLPDDLLVAEIPAEDLGLLEDLEFATWLAHQEQEATY